MKRDISKLANQKFGKPVYYAFYDYDSGKFINLKGVKSKIDKLKEIKC